MKRTIRSFLRKFRESRFMQEILKDQTNAKTTQLLLQQHYRSLAKTSPQSLPTFRDVGFRQYSEFDEDGILLFLFSLIPPKSRICLEICAGDGMQCNTANLIINHGWWGCLFDGNANNVRRGTDFFRSNPDTFLHPPTFRHAWITAENVNQLILDAGLKGEIDLLSLDIDGMDYWIWKAIDAIQARVVVCEVQNPIPPDLSLTIPYDPNFQLSTFEDEFRGASLGAMVNLGRSKGYRLVGTHRFGLNAFFVKNGLADDLLPEVSPEQCATDPYTQLAQRTRWPKVKGKKWVEV